MSRVVGFFFFLALFVAISLAREPRDSKQGAKNAYVPIEAVLTIPGSPDTVVVAAGSGVIVRNDRVVTCLHMYDGANHLVVSYRGVRYWTKVLYTNPEHDLMVLGVDGKKFKCGGITYDLKPAVGERVYAFSNMFELDGAYMESMVMKVTKDFIFIYPPIGAGASGTAVYSESGVIGIFTNNYIYGSVAVSMLIPAAILKGGPL